MSENVTDRAIFVVVEGVLEVKQNGETLAWQPEGGVVGEIAWLLKGRRTADVIAATPARVLVVLERALNTLIESGSPSASRFLLNLSRILAEKLARATGKTEGFRRPG